MSKIFRYLHPRYHEAFYCDTEIMLLHTVSIELRQERFSCPGFWYSVDTHDNVVRTGCARNVYASLAKFQKQPCEVKMRILTSYWSGDDGFRLMKDYKQCFRRVMKHLKHLPSDGTVDLNDAFGSCYTFELVNVWNKN